MYQKMITKQIEKKMAKKPLYSTEGKNEVEVLCKFFNPYGAGRWYVIEAEKQADGDWLFFGMVEMQAREFGYFTLNELKSVRVLERDMYFSGKKLNKTTKEIC